MHIMCWERVCCQEPAVDTVVTVPANSNWLQLFAGHACLDVKATLPHQQLANTNITPMLVFNGIFQWPCEWGCDHIHEVV